MDISDNRVLTPSGTFALYDGTEYTNVWLTNDNGCWSDKVMLGCYDIPENWRDATDEEYREWLKQQEEEEEAAALETSNFEN